MADMYDTILLFSSFYYGSHKTHKFVTKFGVKFMIFKCLNNFIKIYPILNFHNLNNNNNVVHLKKIYRTSSMYSV